MSHDAQSDDTAKLWVKKPEGAIFRRESKGAASSLSLPVVPVRASFAAPWSDSTMLKANGLDIQLPGSAGKASRPPTVKLLMLPPASAAHRWPRSVVAMSGFCPSGTILPPAGEMGDWITTVPCWPNCDEAEITLVESGNSKLVVMLMFPPDPWTACARIWLFCKITVFGSIVMFPPLPAPPRTDVLTVLLLN